MGLVYQTDSNGVFFIDDSWCHNTALDENIKRRIDPEVALFA